MPVDGDQLAGLLAELPGTEVTIEAGTVLVHVPAIGDTVRVDPAAVLTCEQVETPVGAPGVELGLRHGHQELPLIITVGDVVFMPGYPADLLEPGADLLVPATPHLVTYSEMHRDVRALGRAVDDPAVHLDPRMLSATLLLHRCFLAGAVRAGLWPIRVAAWWQYCSARTAGSAGVSPFRADPQWDALLADVAAARRKT